MNINYSWKLNFIFNAIKEGRENGVSDKEIYEEIKQTIPPEVKIIEKPTKLGEEQKQYLRDYRKMKKEDDKIDNEKEKERIKIEKMVLKSNKFLCPYCRIGVEANPKDNTYFLKNNRYRPYKTLIINNFCPKCSKKLTKNGGKF